MGDNSTQHLARNALLRSTLELGESLGVDRHEILREIKLDPVLALQPTAFVPSEAIVDAVEVLAARTARNDIGLMVAERQDHRLLGALGLLLEQSSSVAEMNSFTARFMKLHNSALRYEEIRERSRDIVRLHISARSAHEPRHYTETLASLCMRTAAMVLGPNYRPRAVHFKHARIGPMSGYRRVFGDTVKFRQAHNEFVLPPGDLDKLSGTRETETKGIFEKLLRDLESRDKVELHRRVERLVRVLVGSGDASIGKVAAILKMPPRTLQRRLKARGTSFAETLAQVRLTMAREYIREGTLTMREIAPLLGFSEASALSRFLRKAKPRTKRAHKAPPPHRRKTSAREYSTR